MNKITIECVVFGYNSGSLEVLLSKKIDVGAKWGFISTALRDNESVDEAVSRLLSEFSIHKNVFISQLMTSVDLKINRSVTIVYYGLINMEGHFINLGKATSYYRWSKVKEIPNLTCNLHQVLDLSLDQLSNYFRKSEVGFNLLPAKFTLSELMNVYREILGIEAVPSHFCEKIIEKNVILPLNGKGEKESHTVDKFYRFNRPVYEKFRKMEILLNF